MLSIVLIAWELFGQSYSFDTPLLIISSAFEINMNQAFGLIAGVIIASAIFWSYLIGSFVDKDQIILSQQKTKEQTEEIYANRRTANDNVHKVGIIVLILVACICMFIFL
jgi:hypothetical protein